MMQDRPPGWGGFVALRRKPETKPKRHGNWLHGGRSKAGREAGHDLRRVLAFLRNGTPMPSLRRPLGWRGLVRLRCE